MQRCVLEIQYFPSQKLKWLNETAEWKKCEVYVDGNTYKYMYCTYFGVSNNGIVKLERGLIVAGCRGDASVVLRVLTGGGGDESEMYCRSDAYCLVA